MNGKCDQCGKVGDMRIYDCGLDFCSSECRQLYRYRPNMTDETYEYDTTIDEIEYDGGKEFITLLTPDAFYAEFSGFKCLIEVDRAFYHKQVGSFHSIAAALSYWQKCKEKYGKSWADLRSKSENIPTI